ncbi:MAG TPA: hypothetical protein VGD98_23530 [Ktedonobacteraceae bacterium]
MPTVYHTIVALLQHASHAAQIALPMVGPDALFRAVITRPLDPLVAAMYITINPIFCMEK